MIYENNDILRGMLQRGGKVYGPANLAARQFLFDTGEFERMRVDVQFQHPRFSSEEGAARAAFRLLTSGAPPEVAAHVPTWQERARQTAARWARQAWSWMKIARAIVVLLCAVTVLLLAAPAHSGPRPEQMRVIHRAADGALFAPQQPGGLIVQFRNQGSVLATRPAGLLTFDCSTNMSCSFSGSTFTLTSSASAGSSFDLITTGTNTSATITVDTGGTLTFCGTGNVNARKINGVEFSNGEALGKIPIGQGDGTAVWADPLVQGVTAHDDPGTTTNPVLVGGYVWAAAPTDVTLDGDAVRAWFLRNGSQVFNLASGGSLITQGQKSMSASLPVVLASDQSAVSVTGPLTDAELRASAVTVDGSGVTQPVSAASLPLPTGASTSANQSTEITSLQKLDNVAHAGSDVALSEHVPISGQFDDVATTGVTEN